jgi:hypothetical protein
LKARAAPAKLHLHFYRLRVKLKAGEEQSIAFSIFATSRIRLESPAAQNTPAKDKYPTVFRQPRKNRAGRPFGRVQVPDLD